MVKTKAVIGREFFISITTGDVIEVVGTPPKNMNWYEKHRIGLIFVREVAIFYEMTFLCNSFHFFSLKTPPNEDSVRTILFPQMVKPIQGFKVTEEGDKPISFRGLYDHWDTREFRSLGISEALADALDIFEGFLNESQAMVKPSTSNTRN